MNRLAENLDVFFKEFTTVAIKQDGSTIEVIFDYEYNEFLDNSEGRNITALLPTARISSLQLGEGLTARGRQYEIQSIQPQNDEVISKLILKEV